MLGVALKKSEIIIDIAVASDVVATFNKAISVTLPCGRCQRIHRTVSFSLEGSEGAKPAKCWPGSVDSRNKNYTHPPYPGKLLDLEVKRTETGIRAIYHLEYEMTPFVDRKYPKSEFPEGPTWGRVNFVLDCPKCKRSGKHSTQSNICRPMTVTCNKDDCDYIFYEERREMPLLRWQNPETGEWHQHAERWGDDYVGP